MKKLINQVRKVQDNLITYETISSHIIGQKVLILNGVYTERLGDNAEGTMFFRLCMEKGTLIHSNHHDCTEDIVLYKGSVLEVISNKELEAYKILRIQPKQSHSFYAMEDSILYAQLYKPKN